MKYEQIAQLQAFLLRHRSCYLKPPRGRRHRRDEYEVAQLLRALDEREREALDGLMAGMGFELHEFDDTMDGIPRGGVVWVVLRAPDAPRETLLGTTPVWQRLSLRSDEPKATTVYWFTFLWMLTMSFLYERISRPVSAVSDYISAEVTREELEAKTSERLEEMRLETSEPDPQALPIAAALLGGSGRNATTTANIRKRVGHFLDAMDDAGMLELVRSEDGETVYRQTLLCAAQINELFSQDLIHVVEPEQIEGEMNRFLSANRSRAANNSADADTPQAPEARETEDETDGTD